MPLASVFSFKKRRMDVYEETNDELARLVDSFGEVDAPPSAQASTPERERRRIVRVASEHTGRSEWYRALAGTLGLESVSQLFDSDDVDDAVEHRTRHSQRKRRECSQETALRDRIYVLERSLEKSQISLQYLELGSLPQSLIPLYFRLSSAEQDIDAILRPATPDTPWVRERLSALRGAEDAPLSAFAPLALFELYWDNDSEKRIDTLLEASVTALLAVRPIIYGLRPQLIPSQSAILPPPLPNVVGQGTKKKNKKNKKNKKIVGAPSMTVDSPASLACYNEVGLRSIVTAGCELVYGTHFSGRPVSYTQIIARYLFAQNRTELELVEQDQATRINLMASSETDEDGHPPAVWRVVRKALGGNNDSDSESELESELEPEYDETRVKNALISHFLWCYLKYASAQRLGEDWQQYGRKPINIDLRTLVAVRMAVEHALGEYISLVLFALLDARSPFLRDNLFRLPLRMRTHDFSIAAAGTPLESLNSLFGDALSIVDLVQSDALRQRLQPFASAIAQFSTQPALLAYGLVTVYMELVQQELEPRLRAQLTEAERQLASQLESMGNGDGDDEDGDGDGVITTGIRRSPRMRVEIERVLELAYGLMEQHCKNLKGLPPYVIQSQMGADTGLQSAFLCFVAALIVERDILSGKAYRSRYQMRGAIVSTHDALYALKRYGFRKLSANRYNVYQLRHRRLKSEKQQQHHRRW